MTPKAFNHYSVIRPLGSGGMADVYLAHDPTLGRQVAIKAPHPDLLNAESRARFAREARAAAGLGHFAIVPIYDYNEHGGLPYMVMRCLTGGSLESRIARRPLAPAAALPIIERIAAALDYAHSRDIIHRDVKSANILFDDKDNAYLSDFGIAWMATSADTRLTSTGEVRGTFDYISPEQARGEKNIDGRSDLYSLGIVLFEMLTGDVPYQADSAVSLAVQHISAPIPDIRARRPDLPPNVQNVIVRALAKQREDRYPSGAALLADLQRALSGQRVATPRPTPRGAVGGKATAAPAGRMTWLWAVGVVVVLGVIAFALLRPSESAVNVTTPLAQRPTTAPTTQPEATSTLAAVVTEEVIADPTERTEAVEVEAAAQSAAPVAPALPDEIAFYSSITGEHEIFIIEADGDNRRQLTFSPGADMYPRVSPDGSRIAFVSERDGNPEIYVMNRDGSEQMRLTDHPTDDIMPAWSPDSRRIVFQSKRNGSGDLFIMNEDGTGLTQITTTSEREGHVSWSVDDRLVYNMVVDSNYQLFSSALDGSDRRRLTDSRVDEWSPEWSPDGNRILFLSERDTADGGIYVMDADGGNVRALYNSPAEDWGAVWSADGSQIAFSVSQTDATDDLYIMNADGSGVRLLAERAAYPSWAVGQPGVAADPGQTRGGGSDLTAIDLAAAPIPLRGDGLVQLTFADAAHSSNYTTIFAPDQSYILLSVEMGDNWQIFEADPNGGGLGRQLTYGPYDHYQADLSPDGQTFLTSANLDGNGDVYLFDAVTGEMLQKLTNDYPLDYHPRWMPDGEGFIYSTDDDGTGNDEVFMMTLDGRRTQLTDNSSFDGFATPSHDGRYVAFYSGRDGDYEIYVMDIDGSNPRRLTTSPGRDASPSFSPDGRWVVFESERGGRYEVYAVPFEGGETYRITDAPGDTYFPIISPDGQWLMFQSTRNGEMDIYRQPWEPPLP